MEGVIIGSPNGGETRLIIPNLQETREDALTSVEMLGADLQISFVRMADGEGVRTSLQRQALGRSRHVPVLLPSLLLSDETRE